MTELTGQHYIAGDWVDGGGSFCSDPVSGSPLTVCAGGAAEMDAALRAAEEAFVTYGWMPRERRAEFLDAIAEEIEARVDAIVQVGMAETGLPEPRLRAVELPRTANQLRLFAAHVRDGAYLDRRHDAALPERQPMPRPDLRMMQRPLGPVGVFGASNFPLAFSTAGGDTAAALAAGCPVVYKGHPGHPGCGELVARAIAAAAGRTGMPTGVFGFVQSNTNEAGEALVTHPLTRAVGFTGSYRGGKALFDLAMARDEPIPFFGELGAVNPVFVLPAALAARGERIGADWAASLVMGVGQFCTNPGVVVLPNGAGQDAFVEAARAALAGTQAQPMLTAGTAGAYRDGLSALAGVGGVETLHSAPGEGREGGPGLFAVSGDDWLQQPELAYEVFGPAGLVVRAADADQVQAIAQGLSGQLTATLQMEDEDLPIARALIPVLERKAGRVLVNGFPTGVEVADAMVHGGPFPASTNFGATSVGTLAIRRFLRPVCYQNMPSELLPEDLRD
ncbi:aldehyde dehydrogenase (NADP(+)) [Roseobacter sp. HKCCA0434]|uniref:aldehyde dehydrogenase (NADP(+)) n=1 Tax=Roseobacter sp. HKCCA0434 TaxID=3079297 RepID=UPI002905F1E4|nr:aldehyde dehydrogenase (NADP(+)) [Roseobacter sp. HKCCA0434]